MLLAVKSCTAARQHLVWGQTVLPVGKDLFSLVYFDGVEEGGAMKVLGKSDFHSVM